MFSEGLLPVLSKLGPRSPQELEGEGLVAETTEVHQKPLVHCPFTLKSLCHVPAYPYSPQTTPLSRLDLLTQATESRGCLSSWNLQDMDIVPGVQDRVF